LYQKYTMADNITEKKLSTILLHKVSHQLIDVM